MTLKQRQTEKIVTATLDLITHSGLAGISMSNIAQRAGLSRQTVYNYFPDTGSILEAALAAHLDAMAVHVDAVMGKSDTLAGKLAALAGFLIDVADLAHAALPLDAGLSAAARARLSAREQAPRDSIARAVKAELGNEAPALADLLWAQIEAGAATAARHPDRKPDILAALLAATSAAIAQGDLA